MAVGAERAQLGVRIGAAPVPARRRARRAASIAARSRVDRRADTRRAAWSSSWSWRCRLRPAPAPARQAAAPRRPQRSRILRIMHRSLPAQAIRRGQASVRHSEIEMRGSAQSRPNSWLLGRAAEGRAALGERVGLVLEQRRSSAGRAAAAARPGAGSRRGRGAIRRARRPASRSPRRASPSGSAPNWRASAFIVWAGRTRRRRRGGASPPRSGRPISRRPRGNSRGCARSSAPSSVRMRENFAQSTMLGGFVHARSSFAPLSGLYARPVNRTLTPRREITVAASDGGARALVVVERIARGARLAAGPAPRRSRAPGGCR